MILQTTTDTIDDERGHPVPVNQPLIARPERPVGGWGVTVVVRGMSIDIGGTDANHIARRFRRILSDSGSPFSDNAVWATLNAVWMPLTREKNLLVTPTAFREALRVAEL